MQELQLVCPHLLELAEVFIIKRMSCSVIDSHTRTCTHTHAHVALW